MGRTSIGGVPSCPPHHSHSQPAWLSTPCQMQTRKRERRKINKSSVLMAHFHGKLPLSLRRDIHEDTTSTPTLVKSHHPQPVRTGTRARSMSNLIFQFGSGWGGKTTNPNTLNTWLPVCLCVFACLFVCVNGHISCENTQT